MNVERYEYLTNDLFLDYEFISEGPSKKVKKELSFTPQNSDGITYFNLGFGDLDEGAGTVNDLAVTDNKDTEKVLATIAAIVVEFTAHFPDMPVYARGSTPSRTRLYQMGLSAHWKEIEQLLSVYGYANNEWTYFEKM